MRNDKRPSSEQVAREIDNAEPSEEVKHAVEKDMEAHLPADMIPGQTAQEPLVKSQREAENEAPGAL